MRRMKPNKVQLRRQHTKNPFFYGVSEAQACKSLHEAFSWINSNSIEIEQRKEMVQHQIERFIHLFYKKVNAMGNSTDEQWINRCKDRHKELQELLSLISRLDEPFPLYLVFQQDKVYETKQITYVTGRYRLSAFKEDDGELVDVYIGHCKPNIYGPLHVAMLNIIEDILQLRDTDEEQYNSFLQMAQIIISFGGLYCEFNPDSNVLLKQEKSTLELLTNPPSSEVDEEIDTLFQEVLIDINEGTKPYVREFATSMRMNAKFIESSYTEDDYYYSLKASSTSCDGYPAKQSLLKSCYETDPLAGCSFDNITGYTSHYNKEEPSGYHGTWVKTIHIYNPSKFKSRAIHISMNAIQDRCNYIHRRLMAFNTSLLSDCTKDQSKGQLFLLQITHPQWREENGWPSVLCMDFSNATDRLSQKFQEQVLSILFKREIVEFWHIISTCEKEFRFSNHDIISYKQTCGQPQGLLGSFDAFTLAHHVIMLMTMKLSGLEGYKASQFYRVLGDDSAMTSIKSDPTNQVGDNYVRICQWANMDINRTKSTEILADDKIALADFAKVTILNGKYFSPVPTRIQSRIGDDHSDYYSFSTALWMGQHGYSIDHILDRLIEKYYHSCDEEFVRANTLLYGEIIPLFSEYKDFTKVNPDIIVSLELCYLISKLQGTFAQALMGDKVRESLSMTEFTIKDGIESLLPPDLDFYLDKIEDKEHKFLTALERNLTIEDALKHILGIKDARSILPVLQLNDVEIDVLLTVDYVMDLYENGISNDEVIRPQLDKAIHNMKSLDRFNIRSIYKRNALELMIFRNTLSIHASLFPMNKTSDEDEPETLYELY